jgi:AcrR family transcriptional regulator
MAESKFASEQDGSLTANEPANQLGTKANPLPNVRSEREDGESNARVRLLEAAGPVFAAHGFEGATVREICAAAHVNVASVGYYFGDKLGLYREVIRGIRDSREKRFPTPTELGEMDPRRTLFKIVQTLLSRMLTCDEAGWETQLLMREMNRPTPVFESLVNECFRPQFERLVDTLKALTVGDAPRYRLEQLALSVLGQCLYYRIGSGVVQVLIPERELRAHFDIPSLSRHITAVMLAAASGGTVLSQIEDMSRWLPES